jgi:predicted DNA-binding WGR domain protein
MQPIYMERRNPEANVHRFYQILVTAGLFDDWSVVREWGRCGSPGTLRFDWFDSYDEAVSAAQDLYAQKIKKGYLEK